MTRAPGRRAARECALALVAVSALLPPNPRAAYGQGIDPDEARAAVAAHLPQALADYRELLSFPNDAHAPADILRQLEYVEGRFVELGFETQRLPTATVPLLLAERPAPGADRTVLVYLQADGQPVDPSAWSQDDPWTPVVKAPVPGEGWETVPWDRVMEAAETGGRALDPEWRVFARSASDSKGPVAQLLAALEIAREAGIEPGFDLKIIVDSEEEMGSPRLPGAVERFRDRLAADMLVIFDGPPHASGEPTLKFGARGIATATLTTYGPRLPQHSGHYGNYAPNPVFRMAEILASMKDRAGRVVIPGWYDGVELDAETKRILAEVPDDEAWIQERLGIAMRDSVGDNLQEAVQYPSLNVRGIEAGWVGDEVRTIVPATAVAEIDVRLVRESDPERLLRLLREHVEGLGYTVLDRAPTEAERLEHPRLATLTSTVAYAAFRTDFDSEPGRWLTRAYTRLYGEDPIRIRTSGGSIPISPFVETLGVPAVSVPTVNPDNNQHSPDENLRMKDFVEGMVVMLTILAEPMEAPGG